MISSNNYKWFDSDLHYKYVRFLLKDLGYGEIKYLKFLREGIDSQLINTFTFIDEYGDDLSALGDMSDWQEYYTDSWLEMLLITMMNNMLDANKKYINDFYNQGSNLAYSHMGKDKLFLESDKQALNNLINYTGSVVESINKEYTNGLVNSIGEHVENNTLDTLKQDILTLNTEHWKTPFSVDTRCIFATKTEYARSVNTGLLQGYSNYGVDLYDWVTSGLPNTCKRCLELENNNP